MRRAHPKPVARRANPKSVGYPEPLSRPSQRDDGRDRQQQDTQAALRGLFGFCALTLPATIRRTVISLISLLTNGYLRSSLCSNRVSGAERQPLREAEMTVRCASPPSLSYFFRRGLVSQRIPRTRNIDVIELSQPPRDTLRSGSDQWRDAYGKEEAAQVSFTRVWQL